jgi:spore coat protein H
MPALLACALFTGACVAPLDGTEPDDDDDQADSCHDIYGKPIALDEDRDVYDGDRLEVMVVDLEVDDLAGLAAVDADEDGAEVAARFIAEDDGTVVESAATLELRGQSSRLANQKSYKVHLDGATWRGQKELNLNKHPYDLTRVRNSLSFALFRTIPHFASARTQLVSLFINGEDRGLYTHIEEVDDDYLARHGLDADGTLYKARLFEFFPIDGDIDLIIEAKANEDPDKLNAMIADVNDWSRDIDDVIAAHFNRDNYVTWLAVNLMLGNFDTRNQNFYLYSPPGCGTWYFLPWDYDGALGFYEQPKQLANGVARPRWRSGPANWWGTALHERFFREPGNLDQVTRRMDDLRNGPITDAAVAAILDAYRDDIRAYVTASPDMWNLPVLRGTTEPADIAAQWEAEYDRLYGMVDFFAEEYRSVIERPMPVFVWEGAPAGGMMMFEWSPSWDLQGDDVSYDFELSTSPDFAEASMVERHEGLGETWVGIPPLASGEYWWRVIIRDNSAPDDNWQLSFETARQLVVP